MGRRPVNVGAPPIGVPFAPELPTGLDTGAVQLIAVDFGKICDVYLFQINERAEATKLFITLASAPFIILSAFGITDIITFVNAEENRPKTILEILSSLPNFMYLFFFLAGLIGFIPYHRFVAAHCQAYKMMRYMNSFRLLYYTMFRSEFISLKWIPQVESDPYHPIPRFFKIHWVSFLICLMAAINTTYIAVGVTLFDKSQYLALGIAIVASLIMHIALGRIEWTEGSNVVSTNNQVAAQNHG